MENVAGKITHSIFLNVTTHEKTKGMTFLVTDIGNEDILLGYPWLAEYEPKFSWRHTTIDENALPVIIKTIDPQIQLDEAGKLAIVKILEDTTMNPPFQIRNTKATELAIQAKQYTQQTEVPQEYKKFAKLFSEEESQQYPPKRRWDHKIELAKDAPTTLNLKVFPLNQEDDATLRQWLDEQQAKGYIRPSKSPYTSSFFFVGKKDGKRRPVQDYRKLNEITVRNQYPLPLISDLITDLQHVSIYMKLDICWGYNNIRIKEGDEYKAAFKMCYGLFEPTVMFFGLTNSPATFQTMMNHIFHNTIIEHEKKGTTIRVYMDDIAIGSRKGIEGHHDTVTDILKVAEEHDLYFKPEKCVFHAFSIDYLGVILEGGVTCMDPIKVEGMQDWPKPKNLTDVHAFLGFCNYYQMFIKDFAKQAKPLINLTKKDVTWQWTEEEQEVMDNLKNTITSKLVL